MRSTPAIAPTPPVGPDVPRRGGSVPGVARRHAQARSVADDECVLGYGGLSDQGSCVRHPRVGYVMGSGISYLQPQADGEPTETVEWAWNRYLRPSKRFES